MGKVDLEKLRSIRQGGKVSSDDSRVRTLTDDETGATTGFEIDHYDGRKSAVVRPATIKVKQSISTGEVTVNGQNQ